MRPILFSFFMFGIVYAGSFATTALGQGEPPVPPVPPTVNGSPADEKTISFDYPNNPVSDILSLYEKLTNKVLVRDANLTGPNISIVAPDKMTKAEAIRLIEASLLLNGYAFVPDGENRVKVLNTKAGTNARSEGVPLYANSSLIPAGNQVVSYFMQLRFIAVPDAAAIFQQHVVLHTYGNITQVPGAQALVITENASSIREMIGLQELIDVPPAKVTSEFITLKRADAERVAETITKLIEEQRKDTKATGGAPNAAPPPNPQQPNGVVVPQNAGGPDSGLSETGLVAGTVQLIPDVRTNRILVITRPANFPFIKNMIEEFDQAVGLGAPLEYPLKYVSAAEVLPVLADLLTENEKGGAGGAPGAPAAPQNRETRPNQNTSSFNNGNNGSSSGIGGSADSHADILTDPEGDTGPTSLIVGKTRLIADNKANSILVIGPPESQEKVRTLLDKIDKRPPQVYLSTVIGQLRLLNDENFGVDYLKLFQDLDTSHTGGNGLAGSVLNTATSVVNPSSLVSAAAFPATGGLSLYGTVAKNLSIYIHALESTNRFKVLSRPVVYTANNKKATISSGQKVAVPVSTLSNVNSGVINNNTASVASSIDYEDVVLKLEVIPLINADNEVNLKIAQVDDSIAGSQTISGNTVPTIATQLITTTVTVPSGGTVVLGGLITESTTDNKSGIPILMHLPWVGPLFRNTTKNKERDELIILISPNVVNSDIGGVAASQSEGSRTDTGASAFRFAEPPQPKPEMTEFYPKQNASKPYKGSNK